MKKLIWTSILSGFAVVLCVLCMFYVMIVSDKAATAVKNIQNSFSNSQFKAAAAEVEELDEFWESNHTMLSIIIHHDMLEEIEESISLIKSTVKTSEDSNDPDFWLESSSALIELKNLREVEIPTLGNIL
ncbi:MAG: DUF4363 family protein [Clostridia bacterium]|nr:DUF4363 family protein [Clostridia bacterium]